MSAPTATFLTELLEEAQRAIEVIGILLAGDRNLTLQQRNGLFLMQAAYERLCDQLRETLREHNFTREVPE